MTSRMPRALAAARSSASRMWPRALRPGFSAGSPNQPRDQLVAGQGQTLLIAGEAGIGKSRLVAETKLRLAGRGIDALAGHCFETDRTLPYAPFIELLRSAPASIERSRDELVRLLPELA